MRPVANESIESKFSSLSTEEKVSVISHHVASLDGGAWKGKKASQIFRGHGNKGNLKAVKSMGKDKWLVVIYREISKEDGFVITAYFPNKKPKGDTIWRCSVSDTYRRNSPAGFHMASRFLQIKFLAVQACRLTQNPLSSILHYTWKVDDKEAFMVYLPRTLEAFFKKADRQFPVLLLTGPRQGW